MKNRKYMPRIFPYLMMAILLFSLSACGKSNDTPDAETQRNDQAVTEVSNEGTDNGSMFNTAPGNNDAKILIAYFTAAENSGVDAISSASYTTVGETAVGRVRAVADMIQVHTGGELFSIQTSTKRAEIISSMWMRKRHSA